MPGAVVVNEEEGVVDKRLRFVRVRRHPPGVEEERGGDAEFAQSSEKGVVDQGTFGSAACVESERDRRGARSGGDGVGDAVHVQTEILRRETRIGLSGRGWGRGGRGCLDGRRRGSFGRRLCLLRFLWGASCERGTADHGERARDKLPAAELERHGSQAFRPALAAATGKRGESNFRLPGMFPPVNFRGIG